MEGLSEYKNYIVVVVGLLSHILQSFLWQNSNSRADKPTRTYTTLETTAAWPPKRFPISQPKRPTNNQFKPPTTTSKKATM